MDSAGSVGRLSLRFFLRVEPAGSKGKSKAGRERRADAKREEEVVVGGELGGEDGDDMREGGKRECKWEQRPGSPRN